MQNAGFVLVSGLLALAGSIGCNDPIEGSCPRPLGTYDAQYNQVGGNCQPGFMPYKLKFSQGDELNSDDTEIRFSDTVTTRAVLKGCEVVVSQEVNRNGKPTSGVVQSLRTMYLTGSLYVEDEASLYGTIDRTDYMEDGATIRCVAQYEALYTRGGSLIGAAARD